jgi:Carboxypeptidase regulatory-like domain/TonB dependent receptor
MKTQMIMEGYKGIYFRFRSTKLRMLLSVTLALWGIIPTSLRAQITAGSINGIVADSSQSRIPGAAVAAKNTATSAIRETVTNKDGLYGFSQLIPGNYVITVSKTGFATYEQRNITLQASQALEIDLQLTVGSVSQQVVVTTAPSLLDTEDANHDVTLTTQDVQNLPISSHSSLGTVWATGGVVSVHTGMNGNSPTTGDQQQDRFSMDGGRDMQSAILVDGISLTAGDWGGAIGPPAADSTNETHAFRNTYDTQYGKTDGGVLSLTTRGGSPSLHGSAYFNYQGQALNANSWTNDRTGIAKTPYNNILYGGHVAGPIWRSKHMYYFGNYEASRNSTPASTGLQSVPTPAECNGDFSNVFSKSGTSYVLSTLYDPLTQVTSGNTYTRTSFIAENGGNTNLAAGLPNPANFIPASKINSQGQQICKFYSLFPAAPASVTAAANGSSQTNVNNYSASASKVNTQERFDFRGDWAPSEKFTAYGTWMRQYSVSGGAEFYGHGLDTGSVGKNPTNRILLSATYVPSPTFVLNITGAASVWHQNDYSLGSLEGADATTFGFPAALTAQLPINNPPNFSVGNYTGLGQGRNYYYTLRNNDVAANATKTLNKHTIRFGYQMTVQLLNDYNENSLNIGADRNLTSSSCAESVASAPCVTAAASTSSTTTGDGIASLLLGTISSASTGYAVVPASTQKYAAVYGEDAWKVSTKLTFNYGVRYEIQFGRTERYNRYNHFDPTVINPVLSALTGTPVKGGLIYANNENRGLWKTTFNNVAPRIGFSYRVKNNITARAGYGIFYSQNTSEAPNTNSDGFSSNTTGQVTQNLNAGLAPQDNLNNPFLTSGIIQPTGSSLGLMQDVGNSVSSAYYARPTPYTQTYSLGVQYQTPNNGVIEIGYQGSQGRRLPVGYGQNVNQLPTSYLYSQVSGGVSTLNNSVMNPFAGQGQFSPTKTVAYNQLLRPYPQFTSVNISQDQTMASASYNALLVSYSQRMSKGLSATVNYQFSKALDNTSETGYNNDSGARDIYNLSLERSVSGHDMPQQFTGSVVWKLPIGRGMRFGGGMNRIADAFVGGWQLSTVTILNKGFPISITNSSNPISGFGFGESRPNVTSEGAIRPAQRTLTNWFNAAAFSVPCWSSATVTTATSAACPTGTGPTFSAIGNIRRFEAADRQGAYIRPDMTLQKNFLVTGEKVIAVHVAAFNLTNTPFYATPNTSVGSSTFGQVTGTGAGYISRTIELGGRFTF